MISLSESLSEKGVDAYLWVNENLPKIKKHILKYLPYSPYEFEEFIQTAYEAAILAEMNDGYEFERSFWFHFRKTCLNMTYSHGSKDVKCYHDEYREDGDDYNPPTCAYMPIQPAPVVDAVTISDSDRDIALEQALNAMSQKEKEVWDLLLDGVSLRGAAKHLGKSLTTIKKLKKAGACKAANKLSALA